MKISELIDYLEEVSKVLGDIEVLAFHHEGGNSLRAYPDEITNYSFLLKNKRELVIGGYYDPPSYYEDTYERVKR